ncbi:MAG: YceI family protein [Anaerolineaceae bacterium]|nr:YceI family protein [Anaerolineaceae bacterium]
MKIFQRFLLIAVLALTLAACASPQIPASGTEKVTIVPSQTTTVEATKSTGLRATETSLPAVAENQDSGSSTAEVGVYVLIPEKSKASYRITEQLVNNDLPNDAIGTTSGISGSIKLLADGTVDKENSKITVDLSKLQSDRSMRDNYVRRNILQTAQYPEAVFVPVEIKGLSNPIPQSGSVSFQVSGDLTIRDVTKPVTWDVTGEIVNGEATGKATTNFAFADFDLTQPKVPVVLSVEDKIILEVEVALKPSGK